MPSARKCWYHSLTLHSDAKEAAFTVQNMQQFAGVSGAIRHSNTEGGGQTYRQAHAGQDQEQREQGRRQENSALENKPMDTLQSLGQTIMIGPTTRGVGGGGREGGKDTHPSEDGAERLQEHRVLLSCIHPQLFCQAAQQRVVVGGTNSLHFSRACQGNLAPQFLALSVQLPKLAVVQSPQVEQVPNLRLTISYSWLQTQGLL